MRYRIAVCSNTFSQSAGACAEIQTVKQQVNNAIGTSSNRVSVVEKLLTECILQKRCLPELKPYRHLIQHE